MHMQSISVVYLGDARFPSKVYRHVKMHFSIYAEYGFAESLIVGGQYV